MALPFPNPFANQTAQQPVMPRVPWGQNPLVTTMGLSLLGGRNLNEGLSNVAANAGAGMAAKSGMQQFMLAQQEREAAKAEQDARKNQMNEVIKNWQGLSPEQRSLFMADPSAFSQYAVETMKPKETYQPLTDPAQRARYGIPETDTTPYQVSPQGQVSRVGGSPLVSMPPAERAEDSERGKAVAQTMKTYADDGMSAAEMLQNTKRLSQLLSTTETGSSAALTDFVRRNTGIAISDDAGPIQAIQAMVDFMAPRMRPPGAGATSDFDARQFLSSLPSLMGNPTGNAIITQTLGGMAETRLANAQIAQEYLVGRISAEEAFQKMQALPDPFEKFKQWQQLTGNVPKGADPTKIPGGYEDQITQEAWDNMTPEQRALFQ